MSARASLLSSPAMRGADAAIQRAAQAALALARRTGTPCWVWQDGRLVDIARRDAPAAPSAKAPPRSRR